MVVNVSDRGALLALALDPAVAVVVGFRIDDDHNLAVGAGPHRVDVTDRRRYLQQADLGLDQLAVDRVVGGRGQGDAAVPHLLHDVGENGRDIPHLNGNFPVGPVGANLGGPPGEAEQEAGRGPDGPRERAPPAAAQRHHDPGDERETDQQKKQVVGLGQEEGFQVEKHRGTRRTREKAERREGRAGPAGTAGAGRRRGVAGLMARACP